MSSNLVLSNRGLSTRSHSASGSATDIFGSIGSTRRIPIPTSADFIPLDAEGGILDLKGINVNPQWVGLSSAIMQFWAYNFCSPLAAVIDRLAEADTNGRIEFQDEDRNTIKKETVNKVPSLLRIKRLLRHPNPMQTWEEFNSEQVVLSKMFGYCPVFAVGPAGQDKTYTKYLFNLSPLIARPIINDKYTVYGDKTLDTILGSNTTNPILRWEINFFGERLEIRSEDVILVKDGFITGMNSDGLPLSKVAGLDYFISNICASMEADNVLLKKKGPLGVFSFDPRPDMAGWTPMKPKQKDELQDDLKNYGLTLGQLQYIISKTPIKWNAMSFNVRDLMTKETARMGIDGICDRFGYPAELMSGKNATYENRNSAEKFLYQNNIIPFTIRRMSRYNEFFGLERYSLVMDYDHLPVLQEDIMHAGQARAAMSQSLDIDWKNGMIKYNEYRSLQGIDAIPGMDIFYPEWLEKNPTMKEILKPKKDATSSKDTGVKK